MSIMCICIHFISAWSKLDHGYSFRLRLVCAPHCPDYLYLIAPSLYHHFEVSLHSPVLITYLILNPTGENTLHNYFCTCPSIKFRTLLKLLVLPLKVPFYYHGPLISNTKREWVNRSIEGDASIRVGLLQRDECISCLIKLSAW